MGEVNSVDKKSSHYKNQYTEYRQRNEIRGSTIASNGNSFEQQLSSTQKSAQKEAAEKKNDPEKSETTKDKDIKKVEAAAASNSAATTAATTTASATPTTEASTTPSVPMSGSAQDRMMSKLKAYEPQIKAAAARYELPEELIAGIIWQESRANPTATSHCGAQGLMQLMPGTARNLGVSNAYDASQNIDGGAKYIRQMIDKFGHIEHAVAAYNAGPGNVQKYGGIPPFRETRDYVPKVLGYANNFKVAGGFPSNTNPSAMRA